MRYFRRLFGAKEDKSRIDALQGALEKRTASIEALKVRVEKLSQANAVLRSENVRLKSKVAELYERNKDYAVRIRRDR